MQIFLQGNLLLYQTIHLYKGHNDVQYVLYMYYVVCRTLQYIDSL